MLEPNSSAAKALMSLPKFGNGIGLHRVSWFLDQLPWVAGLDVIKVTGSKGKGSTSRIIAAILSELTPSVGLFTSPHLLRFNERIKVNGCDITDIDLASSAEWFEEARIAYEKQNVGDFVGSFEATFVVAAHSFSQRKVNVLVTEAGIGGRYDSTRCLPGKTVALTSVELEHTNILGNTLKAIAFDKADLCPPGGTLIAGRLNVELRRRLEAYCRLREVTFVSSEDGVALGEPSVADGHMQFSLHCLGFDFGIVSTKLIGKHQIGNIVVAILATWNWLSRSRPDVSGEEFRAAVQSALPKLEPRGRFELIQTDPDVSIDLGHTADSMKSLVEAVRMKYPDRKVLLVTGVSEDKNAEAVLANLLPVATRVIAARAYHKGSPAEFILEKCLELRPDLPTKAVDSIEGAMNQAISEAKKEGFVVLVAGSLFLAIEALAVTRKWNPKDLEFF